MCFFLYVIPLYLLKKFFTMTQMIRQNIFFVSNWYVLFLGSIDIYYLHFTFGLPKNYYISLLLKW